MQEGVRICDSDCIYVTLSHVYPHRQIFSDVHRDWALNWRSVDVLQGPQSFSLLGYRLMVASMWRAEQDQQSHVPCFAHRIRSGDSDLCFPNTHILIPLSSRTGSLGQSDSQIVSLK